VNLPWVSCCDLAIRIYFADIKPKFMEESPNFWNYLDELVRSSRIVIDRPKGSQHPRYPDFIHPLDYGYLEGTRAGDGAGLDVWLGSLKPARLDAVLLTVDLYKRDVEVKLLLGCNEQEKRLAVKASNSEMMCAELIYRQPVTTWLSKRHSVRRFTSQPVERELLVEVLQAATLAPSAHNRQPWRFVALENRVSRESLAAAMATDFEQDLQADGLSVAEVEAQVKRSYQRIVEAPAAILLCLDTSLGDVYPDIRRQQAELLMGVQGVAMAGENLLLAAAGVGLGGVWMCAPLFAQETVRQALDLPESWLPQGLALLGYASKPVAARSRRPLGEVTLFK
jgi:coenzyme F420-0:L-glutamate ligase/coenzyme F420-1:gamma-L-glutamate ligase